MQACGATNTAELLEQHEQHAVAQQCRQGHLWMCLTSQDLHQHGGCSSGSGTRPHRNLWMYTNTRCICVCINLPLTFAFILLRQSIPLCRQRAASVRPRPGILDTADINVCKLQPAPRESPQKGHPEGPRAPRRLQPRQDVSSADNSLRTLDIQGARWAVTCIASLFTL